MPDVFLSYSREDAATARRFAEAFEREGLEVWWDATLRSGEAYDEVTEKALRTAKAVVVLWSTKSVASRWVRAEATMAHRNNTLVPVMIEPCDRPIMFELTQTADLSEWSGDAGDPAWQAFVTDVRRFVAGGQPEREAASIAIAARRSRPGRRGRQWALLATIAVLAGGLAWFFMRHPGVPSPASSTAAAAESGATSIAVLPFADMSPEHDQDYFSDGLSEEVLNQLALIKNLQVAGRTSSFSFKGKGEDLRTIGRKLGVNHLLDGSVRKAGQQLRITAELINATTGIREWSRTYDRKLEDVFAVQEEIAKDVATALSIKLRVGNAMPMVGGTANVAAYEKYLRARALIERGGPDDHQRGIELLRESAALDPGFARAWSDLYLALRYSLVFKPTDPQAVRKEMVQASERALTLAPDAWWTLAMRTQLLRSQHRWTEAESAAKQAVAAASSTEVEAIRAYAEFLNDVGRVSEAIPYFRQMRDADPLSLRVSGYLQVALRSGGQLADAEMEYERSKDLAGSHDEWEWYALLRLWAQKNSDPAAVASMVRDRLARGSSDSVLRKLQDKLYDPAAARAILRESFKDPDIRNGWTQVTGLALMADHFGDRDLALSALSRRIELIDFHYIAWWPYETQLRTDPRFKQIVRALKLDDYWRNSGHWGDFCKPAGKDDFECH